MNTKKRILSYLLKLTVIFAVIVGVWQAAVLRGSSAFMYFTIQSNILIAIICAIGLILMAKKQKISDAWFTFKFVGTVAITLTGVVFCFILAPNLDLAWGLSNTLTHVVVPVAAILDFFVTGTQGNLSKKDVLWVTLPPSLYTIYAAIGYVQNWSFDEGYNFPYFFFNWGSPAGAFGFTKELPFMGTAWWILVLLIFLIIVGFLYLAIIKRLRKI